jgi:uncharacterized protein
LVDGVDAIQIYVDADACPVKDEVLRVAERHKLIYHVVSNSWMRLTESAYLRRVVVPDGPDVADDWIVEHITAIDIVVTADIPLAARCLAKGARGVGMTGKPFTADSIGMALAMRNLHADLREAGAMGSGNAGFTRDDRSRFLRTLEDTIQAIKREVSAQKQKGPDLAVQPPDSAGE